MSASRRPLVDFEGSTWLGHPQAPHLRIELTDEALVLHAPSGDTVVPWASIRELEADIPVANWTAARLSRSVLAAMDNLQIGTSDGVSPAPPMRFGNRDIRVRLVLTDDSEVIGWAQKHQPLGYPEPEARAAIAVLQGRVGRP